MCRSDLAFTLGVLLAATCGCSNGNGGKADAGTPPATGGVSSQGGALASGGSASSGGIAATGGAIPTGAAGGTLATGGASATGGSAAPAAGGATPMGGTLVTGGATAKGGAAVTGGMAATGGRTATGGMAVTGGSTATGGSGSCNLPACYTDLVSGCSLGGACVEQRVAMCGASPCPQPLGTLPSSIIATQCYGNGITAVEVTDTASTNTVTTVKKSGTACYSYETQYSTASLTSLPMVLKNPAGNTVVTSVIDNTNGTATVVCTGSPAVVVSADCLSSSPPGGTATCTTGTCAP